MKTFANDLRHLINSYSKEMPSNTPDFILAEYMHDCLTAFERAAIQRDEWYGISMRPDRHVYLGDVKLRMADDND